MRTCALAILVLAVEYVTASDGPSPSIASRFEEIVESHLQRLGRVSIEDRQTIVLARNKLQQELLQLLNNAGRDFQILAGNDLCAISSAYELLGNPQECIRVGYLALSKGASAARAHYALLRCLHNENRFTEGERVLKRLESLYGDHPDCWEFHYLFGKRALLHGHTDYAVSHLTRYFEILITQTTLPLQHWESAQLMSLQYRLREFVSYIEMCDDELKNNSGWLFDAYRGFVRSNSSLRNEATDDHIKLIAYLGLESELCRALGEDTAPTHAARLETAWRYFEETGGFHFQLLQQVMDDAAHSYHLWQDADRLRDVANDVSDGLYHLQATKSRHAGQRTTTRTLDFAIQTADALKLLATAIAVEPPQKLPMLSDVRWAAHSNIANRRIHILKFVNSSKQLDDYSMLHLSYGTAGNERIAVALVATCSLDTSTALTRCPLKAPPLERKLGNAAYWRAQSIDTGVVAVDERYSAALRQSVWPVFVVYDDDGASVQLFVGTGRNQHLGILSVTQHMGANRL